MRRYGIRNATFAERFEANVIRGDGCWLWNGRPNKHGYSMTRIRGRTVIVHRMAYELLVGPIPEGLEIDHLCRNRRCVNPAHLEPVTGRVNWIRGTAPSRGNLIKTHCKNGHPLVEENLIERTDNAPNGRVYRQCRTCRKDGARMWRQRMIESGAPRDEKGRVRAPTAELLSAES